MILGINIRHTGEVSVVDLTGRITIGEGASALRETIRSMAKEGHKKILLNLEDASYIDSAGLGVLVSGFASITNGGGQLKLLNLNSRVRDLLLLTKLFTVFEVFEDEPTAVRSFTAAAAAAHSRTAPVLSEETPGTAKMGG